MALVKPNCILTGETGRKILVWTAVGRHSGAVAQRETRRVAAFCLLDLTSLPPLERPEGPSAGRGCQECSNICCTYTFVGVVHVSVGISLNFACLTAPEATGRGRSGRTRSLGQACVRSCSTLRFHTSIREKNLSQCLSPHFPRARRACIGSVRSSSLIPLNVGPRGTGDLLRLSVVDGCGSLPPPPPVLTCFVQGGERERWWP